LLLLLLVPSVLATVVRRENKTHPNHQLWREQVQQVGHRHHGVRAADVYFSIFVQPKSPAEGVLME